MSRSHVIAFLVVLLAGGIVGYVGCDSGPRLPGTSQLDSDSMPAKIVHQPGPPVPAGSLVLLITGQTSGNLEPCDCPGQPRGGLSRRKTLFDSLQAEFGRCILLDNGNCTPLEPQSVLDRYILDGLGRLGYDAVGFGDQDLDRGPAEFVKLAEHAGVPLVATNIKRVDGGLIGQPYRLISRGGRNVLVLSVIGPQMLHFTSPRVREQVKVADPADAIARTIAQARHAGAKPDMVVVLASLFPGEREPLLASLKEVDLVVLSNERDRDVQLEKIGSVPAVYVPPMGRQIVAVICEGQGRSGRLHVARAVGYAVEQSLPRDRALWEHYQAYTYDAAEQALGEQGLIGQIKYVPPSECGACHATQYQWWQKHPHGRAWAAVQRKGRTGDANCARCHATGFGRPGGFRSMADTPTLVNVGCQACHELDLGQHKVAATPKSVVRVGESGCRRCHTEASSPEFDISVHSPKATCPMGGAASTQPSRP